jgi:hypothetical protein
MGKMANPFYRAGKNQLIWDGDVSPEGIAAQLNRDHGGGLSSHINAGGFWLAERNNDSDTGLFGLQSYIKQTNESGHWLVGASFYCYTNIDDVNQLGNHASGTNRTLLGNTVGVGDQYRYDYDIIEGFGEYGFTCNSTPVLLYGSAVQNRAAPSNRNTGWLVGLTLNKAKNPGDWELGYNYRDIQSDAVFAGLNDSDFIGGGTDGKGHKVSAKYQVAKNLQAAVTYFCNQRYVTEESRTDLFRTLQLDLIFKF